MFQRVNISDALNLDIASILKKDEYLQKPLEVRQIVNGEIWEIPKFLTQQTCQDLIKLTEKQGFQDAPLTIGVGLGVMDKSVRDCTRVMIDDFEAAKLFFELLKPVAPLCYEGALFDSVNERFRFLKYTPGQKFKEHYDGRYPKSQTCVSMITIHLYLNTVESGGATSFFDPNQQWNFKNGVFNYASVEGQAALFRQNGWLHSGSEVKKGVKYSVRNELMYRWLLEPELREREQELRAMVCGLCKKGIKILTQENCKHIMVKIKYQIFYFYIVIM